VLTVALAVGGYVLGSCPWGYWLVRLIKHEDIRKVGSGNIGATNVWRTYGRWLGVPVVLLDTLKGFVPALLGVLFVSPPHLSAICAGAAAMLGHWRPLFLRFAKGGKMVATCGGVFFAVAIWVGLPAIRYTYLGSFLYGDCKLTARNGDPGCQNPASVPYWGVGRIGLP